MVYTAVTHFLHNCINLGIRDAYDEVRALLINSVHIEVGPATILLFVHVTNLVPGDVVDARAVHASLSAAQFDCSDLEAVLAYDVLLRMVTCEERAPILLVELTDNFVCRTYVWSSSIFLTV